MNEAYRNQLYFIGFCAHLFFASRFCFQWISSERAKRCAAPPLFWKLSLAGNLLMWSHGWIQGQLPICTIQAGNLLISYRHLFPSPSPLSNARLFFLALSPLALSTLLFTLQFFGHPSLLSLSSLSLPLSFWHGLGWLGMLLFSLRFWIQWWQLEKRQSGELKEAFWWLSLIGGLLSLTYFMQIGDSVHTLGYGMGVIPYIRNLTLIYNSSNPQGETP